MAGWFAKRTTLPTLPVLGELNRLQLEPADRARAGVARKPRRFRWRALSPYLYILPSAVVLGAFTYYPIMYSIYLSVHRWNLFTPFPVFAGMENFADMLDDSVFWTVAKNTVLYILGSVPITMVLALLFALLLNENLGWMRNVYRTATFYPTMIPMAAAGMLWVWLLNPNIGLINYYLGLVGLPTPDWLYDMNWALPAIILTSIWKNFGYFMIIYLAGLQTIPSELHEAAEVEGANWWNRVRHVTLPLLTPTTVFVVVVAIISSFQVFDLVYVMTQGGPGDRTNVLVHYIYQNGFRFGDIGYSSALTVVFVACILAVVLLLMRFMERRTHYEV